MAVKTIQELIDMKAGIEEKKNKIYSLELESLGEIKYKLATRTELVQIQEMDKENIDPYLIYTHVVEPDLADSDLQTAYEMAGLEPHKIVDKIFSIQEVGKLSLAMIGEKKSSLGKNIKN